MFILVVTSLVAVSSKTVLRMTRKNNVAMCGFPIKTLDVWQRTLVEAGFQLAICNQRNIIG